jgi:hypothetical protein
MFIPLKVVAIIPPTLDHLTSITDAANPSFSPFSVLMEEQTMPALLYIPSE